MSHTPGPWRYEVSDDDQHRIYGGVFPGAERAVFDIADVWFPDCDNGEQVRAANARLIAAAPAMHEALRRAGEYINDMFGPFHPDEYSYERELLAAIDDALSLAEGKEAAQ